MEGDKSASGHTHAMITFQSTPSAWRETAVCTLGDTLPDHFNPLPPHGGRPAQPTIAVMIIYISIHSLRMEGDLHLMQQNSWDNAISIHSLRMEGDVGVYNHIYSGFISIHSLRMEGDADYQWLIPIPQTFQSTPSAWRETSARICISCSDGISIHSLRMEGDAESFYKSRAWRISIHSLRMEGDVLLFLGGGTGRVISIHSLRMEGDSLDTLHDVYHGNFNPLPPHGGRLCTVRMSQTMKVISIHSLRMEGDIKKNI